MRIRFQLAAGVLLSLQLLPAHGRETVSLASLAATKRLGNCTLHREVSPLWAVTYPAPPRLPPGLACTLDPRFIDAKSLPHCEQVLMKVVCDGRCGHSTRVSHCNPNAEAADDAAATADARAKRVADPSSDEGHSSSGDSVSGLGR